MFDEDDLIPISALQHYMFCARQCALIHLERVWSENRLTAEGRILHERAHEAARESRGAVRIERGVALRSLELGLAGRADVVEFHSTGDGGMRPFPVEYKRGRPKIEDWDRVQLCAQALCLEEMLGAAVPQGAIFYGLPRRREVVDFDGTLRAKTAQTAEKVRGLFERGVTPGPEYRKRCDNCSMVALCLPKVIERGRSVMKYLRKETSTE